MAVVTARAATNDELADVVRELVTAQLEAVGFTPSGRDEFIRDLDEDIEGCVYVWQTRRGDAIQIEPVVAVRHKAVERLVGELRGKRGSPAATLGDNVGYLTEARSFRQWLFKGRRRRLQRQAYWLAVEIGVHAPPFFQAHRSLEAIVAALEEGRHSTRHEAAYTLPVCLALLGRQREAAEVLQRAEDELDDRTDVAAEEFRAFANAFRAWLGIPAR